jgi:hypothetical protein
MTRFMQAVTPKISVISDGIHIQHGPVQFHAFQFGHPPKVTVSILEQFSNDNRSPVNVYSMTAVPEVTLIDPLVRAFTVPAGMVIVVSPNADGTTFNVQQSVP